MERRIIFVLFVLCLFACAISYQYEYQGLQYHYPSYQLESQTGEFSRRSGFWSNLGKNLRGMSQRIHPFKSKEKKKSVKNPETQFNPDMLNYFDSSFDETAAAMTMPNLSPWWTQKHHEMKRAKASGRNTKTRFPNCGENYREFDERCCWEEENYLRGQIKMEENQGYIIHAGSYYWDGMWNRCLMSEPPPLVSVLSGLAVVVHGIYDKAQCDREGQRQGAQSHSELSSSCIWFSHSQRCHCLPGFAGERSFRGHSYKMYKVKSRNDFEDSYSK